MYDIGIFRLSYTHVQCTVRSCLRFIEFYSGRFYVGGISMEILACVMEIGTELWFAYKSWKDW